MSTEDKMDIEAGAAAQPIDVSGDGGVLKTVITESTSGWEKPSAGSEVQVHYTGTLLNGEKFDSSRDRNDPFKFTVDGGQVIKGWDVALKSMKKGERASFTLKPEYAYGARGSPPKIGPDATLVFDIELLSFNNEKDISSDGGVLKKSIKEGSEKYGPSPKYETTVKVRLVAKHGETVVQKADSLEVTLGNEQVVSGVEKAIESLKVGEIALFTIKPNYAYGATGDQSLNIPPNATLTYEIELLEMHKEKEDWELKGPEEKVEAANKRKTEGNKLFAEGKLARAIRKYTRALDFVNYLGGEDESENKKQAATVKLPCHLNLAQCYLRLKDNNKVLEECKKALELDKDNVKALFRQGVAQAAKIEWDAAKKSFARALELDPTNVEVKREQQKLLATIADQDRKDKAMFSKMFA